MTLPRDHSGPDLPRGDDLPNGGDALDRLLAESASAEDRHPPVDVDRFMARLRARILPEGLDTRRGRIAWARLAASAAAIPLAIAAWLFLSGPTDGTPGGTGEPVEVALLEELDLLLVLEELTPEEIAELDPDLIDLYQHIDLIDELPVEVLGSTDS